MLISAIFISVWQRIGMMPILSRRMVAHALSLFPLPISVLGHQQEAICQGEASIVILPHYAIQLKMLSLYCCPCILASTDEHKWRLTSGIHFWSQHFFPSTSQYFLHPPHSAGLLQQHQSEDIIIIIPPIASSQKVLHVISLPQHSLHLCPGLMNLFPCDLQYAAWTLNDWDGESSIQVFTKWYPASGGIATS